VGDWQPIETHPKDFADRFLVFNGEEIHLVFWDDTWSSDGWFMCDDGKCARDLPLRGKDPTHWMPLPPSPTPSGLVQVWPEVEGAKPTFEEALEATIDKYGDALSRLAGTEEVQP
jgi:hypothetical protein